MISPSAVKACCHAAAPRSFQRPQQSALVPTKPQIPSFRLANRKFQSVREKCNVRYNSVNTGMHCRVNIAELDQLVIHRLWVNGLHRYIAT